MPLTEDLLSDAEINQRVQQNANLFRSSLRPDASGELAGDTRYLEEGKRLTNLLLQRMPTSKLPATVLPSQLAGTDAGAVPRGLQLRNASGGTTNAATTGDIDKYIGQGYTPLTSSGQAYETKTWGGGTMFRDPTTGFWSPGNVVLGGQYTPEQEAALGEFLRMTGSADPRFQTDVTGRRILKPGVSLNTAAPTGSPTTAPPPGGPPPAPPTGGAPPPAALPPPVTPPPDGLAPPAAGGTTNDLIQKLLDAIDQTKNIQGRGFSPEVLAAQQTQAMESVPARFDEAGRDLATSLLRRGGGLPAGGEFLRGYGPLVAAKEATRSGLMQNLTLANEAEKSRTRESDRAAALQGLGLATTLAGQSGQLELGREQLASQWDIAKLDASTRERLAVLGINSNEKLAAMGINSQEKLAALERASRWDIANLDATTRTNLAKMGIDSNEKLQQMGITSTEKLAEFQRQSNWDLAKLDANTRTNLYQMGIDSNEKLATLDRDLRVKLTSMGIDANAALAKLDAETRLDIASIQSKAGNPGLVAATGIVSSLINNPTVAKAAIKTVGKALGVGGPAALAADLSAPVAADAFVGPTLAGSLAPSGGLGSAAMTFLTNPATLGIGAAIAVGISWLKSQAHWEANTYVKDFQNPFFESFAKPAHDEFFKAAAAGTLTKASATQALNAMESAWAGFQEKSKGWAGDSSDKKEVIGNAFTKGTGAFYTTNTNIIKNMRNVVEAMA